MSTCEATCEPGGHAVFEVPDHVRGPYFLSKRFFLQCAPRELHSLLEDKCCEYPSVEGNFYCHCQSPYSVVCQAGALINESILKSSEYVRHTGFIDHIVLEGVRYKQLLCLCADPPVGLEPDYYRALRFLGVPWYTGFENLERISLVGHVEVGPTLVRLLNLLVLEGGEEDYYGRRNKCSFEGHKIFKECPFSKEGLWVQKAYLLRYVPRYCHFLFYNLCDYICFGTYWHCHCSRPVPEQPVARPLSEEEAAQQGLSPERSFCPRTLQCQAACTYLRTLLARSTEIECSGEIKLWTPAWYNQHCKRGARYRHSFRCRGIAGPDGWGHYHFEPTDRYKEQLILSALLRVGIPFFQSWHNNFGHIGFFCSRSDLFEIIVTCRGLLRVFCAQPEAVEPHRLSLTDRDLRRERVRERLEEEAAGEEPLAEPAAGVVEEGEAQGR